MLLDYYKKLLGDVPVFLEKYLNVPCLKRLKGIGYFCGMDYASKNVYAFSELITRYDHSLTVALLTYKLTNDKVQTISSLFHDVATPCFSHVIDYMNKDYEKQESTEEYTEKILRSDNQLLKCLDEDNISIEKIVDFKKYPIVDCDRPHLCVDRIDGIILTGISWCQNISDSDIKNIVDSLCLYENENGDFEVGFNKMDVCLRVMEINQEIDKLCHSSFDNYMMEMLGDITRIGIEDGLFLYDDLYYLNEVTLLKRLGKSKNKELRRLLDLFYNIELSDIPFTQISNVKKREIRPIVLEMRIS